MFRWLWLAQLGSNIGVWMQTVGAQWFLVEQSHSPALVAWVQAASLLPTLLLSLVAGVYADRADRRVLLIVTNAVAGVFAGVLAWLTIAGVLTPWLLLVMTFLIGSAMAFTAPAWQAIQPELVPRSELVAASALNSVTVNGARAIGPAIAGFIVASFGPAAVFVLNALSFLLVIAALIPWRRQQPPAPREREGVWASLTDGVRYVTSAYIVRRILLRSLLFAFPASALWALMPTSAQTRLGLDADGYGLLLTVIGSGAMLGVLLMPRLRRWMSDNVMLWASALAFALGGIAMAVAPLQMVIPALLASGLAWMMSLTTLNAGLQLTVASWVRARGMAVYLLVFLGSQAIGSFVWGAVAQWVGVSATLLIASGLLVLAALSVWPLPLHPMTGKLDRSIVALCLPTPSLVFDPEPTDGPVLVVRTWSIPPEATARFLITMREVEQSLRRTGAQSWRLFRSGQHLDEFREEFTIRSWSEYQAQTSSRMTGFDRDLFEAAVTLATTPPEQRHYFTARV